MLRPTRKATAAALAILLLGLLGARCRATSPSVILIVADDLGYGDLGSYGQQIIQTPNLDQMAAEGLRFSNFHAGAPVCLLSRCTLMTGIHSGHCRIRNNGGVGDPPSHPPIHEEDILLSEVMAFAGYQTGMIGKWALGDDFVGNTVPQQNLDGPGAVYKHGWDYYFGEPNQTYNGNYFPDHLYRLNHILPEVIPQPLTPPFELVPQSIQGQYSHDALTDAALLFIDSMASRKFFLYVAYQIPHWTWVGVEEEPYTQEQPWTDNEKAYASMITRMDRDIGRILERLDQLGIGQNTLVLFTSDNGGVVDFVPTFDSNGGLPGGKAQLSDGGLMVPLIARAPAWVPPGENDELFAFWDILPTLADLVGIRPPEPIDGISFLPTLKGQLQAEPHDYLYFHYNGNLVKRAPWETRTDQEIIDLEYFPPHMTLVPGWNPFGG